MKFLKRCCFPILLTSLSLIFQTAYATVSLHGKIPQAGNGSVKISYYTDALSGKLTDVFAQAVNGNFAVALPLTDSFSRVYVSTGDYSPIIVIVSPDDDLYFSADFDKMNAPISFKGRGSIKNNFIERRKLRMTEGIARDFMVRSWYKEDAEKLLASIIILT